MQATPVGPGLKSNYSRVHTEIMCTERFGGLELGVVS